jgi:putative peptide zinc metalloprotease protein
MSPPTPVAEVPPQLSNDIRVSEPDKDGISVVKSLRKRRYMRLGAHEAFLLSLLDGNTTVAQIAKRFEQEFGEPVTDDEIRDFVALAKKEGLLKRSPRRESQASESDSPPRNVGELIRRCIKQAKKQSPLFFRVKLFDPNETLNWLEPKTRFLFSSVLAVIALVTGAWALGIVWVDRGQLVQQFASSFGWQVLVVAWITTIIITVFHEFGHGLACKRHGGDVHEMGALWIFFTPCFYCNVSDAWLLPNRWKRLLISLAGTYVDFLVWIVAVFVWRVSSLDSAVNFAAWVIVSTCGLRVAFNLNPLMRLDGYYALCDLLHTHNLRRRARAHFLDHARWLLWGGAKPGPSNEHTTLIIYGTVNWIFTVGFLGWMSFHASLYLQSLMGIGSIIAAVGFFSVLTRRYFRGSLGEDFISMFRARKLRVLIWLVLIAGLLAIPIHDRAGGEFHVRPVVRREVRAPIAGFLREIKADQGDIVSSGSLLAVIEVPELTSNIARKRAEIAESEAILRRLKCGPRQEEIDDQKERIKRATTWRDLAKSDLEKARISFAQEVASLELSIEKATGQLEYQGEILEQMQSLHDRGGLAGQQLLSYKKDYQEASLNASQAKADMQAREAEGLISYESELARREKELADAKAALTLLEAGSRHEDIDAEQARLARLEEELSHFLHQQEKQLVECPVSGTVITPRFKEQIGLYVDRGMPLCVIEDLQDLEAEISVSEKDARVLVAGHPITLKPTSLPLQTLTATVDRIAPAAQPDAIGGNRTVTVYCNVDNSERILRTGMTGFARIRSEKQPLGMLLFNGAVRLLRTEFYW